MADAESGQKDDPLGRSSPWPDSIVTGAARARDRVDRATPDPVLSFRFELIDDHQLLTPADARELQAGLRAVELALATGGICRVGATGAAGVRGVVRVLAVDDSRMVELHGRYSGDATTTDVLTFDLAADTDAVGAGRDARGPAVDADVWVCVDEARRQAALLGHAATRELVLYAVHGLLHCLGFDDADDASFDRMHAAEDDLLTRAGLGAVFAAGESASSGARA